MQEQSCSLFLTSSFSARLVLQNVARCRRQTTWQRSGGELNASVNSAYILSVNQVQLQNVAEKGKCLGGSDNFNLKIWVDTLYMFHLNR